MCYSSVYLRSSDFLALIFSVKISYLKIYRFFAKKALQKQISKIKCNNKCFIGKGIFILSLKLPLIIDAVSGWLGQLSNSKQTVLMPTLFR